MSATPEDLLVSYPHRSADTESNWRAMAQFWHPVATADEVADEPFGTTLLDTDLVLYRTAQGVSAALDMCPHRGAELSQGRIKDDVLICPYHGLHFDGRGQCVRVPAENRTDGINPKLRLTSLPVTERFGLVWASLTAEPTLPIPDWSLLEAGEIGWASVPPEFWNATAVRPCRELQRHLSRVMGPYRDIWTVAARCTGLRARTFQDRASPSLCRRRDDAEF